MMIRPPGPTLKSTGLLTFNKDAAATIEKPLRRHLYMTGLFVTAAALLVFFSGAAGAGIIASDFLRFDNGAGLA